MALALEQPSSSNNRHGSCQGKLAEIQKDSPQLLPPPMQEAQDGQEFSNPQQANWIPGVAVSWL